MAIDLKYAIEATIFWPPADRVVPTGYKPKLAAKDIYPVIKRIEGCDGVELYYPYDFDDAKKMKRILTDLQLPVSAIGIGFFGEAKWQHGGITSFDRALRNEAIDISKRTIDAASELGAGIVVFWPGQDGYDYYFQTDYQKKWDLMVDGLRELAAMDRDMKIGIEYKPKEPRTHQIVPNAVKALKMSEDTGYENVGVIMDIGHSLIAKENPAEEAVYLINRKRLFHLHSNDNYNDWDYDMLPASVHLWENLELFYWLDQLGYKGWINFDICPFREESYDSCELSIHHTKKMVEYVQKLDIDGLKRSINNNDAIGSQQILWKALFG